MNKLFAIVMVAMLLAACAPEVMNGQVEALQPATTARGIEMALQGAKDTVVLQKDGVQVLGWSQSGGWGWACLSCSKDEVSLFKLLGGKGNFGNANTFSDLVSFLKNNGWAAVSGPAVTGVKTAAEWVAANLTSMTILILPIGTIPEELLRSDL